MRNKATGIIERIEAKRDQDTMLPRQARVRLRKIAAKDERGVPSLEFASHPGDVTIGEVEDAIANDRFVTLTMTYDEAIALRVGDEIVLMAYTRSDVAGPDECTVCGSYQPRR